MTVQGSGRDAQTRLGRPGPGRLGCSGYICWVLVSPFPFPIHIPPPSFLFLFWGHRNFLFSSWFKMACWSQLEAQWGGLVTPAQQPAGEGGREGLCIPGCGGPTEM